MPIAKFIAVGVVACLTACGGGGGGSSSPVPVTHFTLRFDAPTATVGTTFGFSVLLRGTCR